MQDTYGDKKDAAPLRWGLFFIVIAVYGVLFRESFAYLASMWATEDLYSQGWLIAAVSVFFAVSAVFSREFVFGRPQWQFAPIILILSVAWALAYVTQTLLLQLFVLPVLFWFCALCCLGAPVARLWLFPAAYFFLSLPFWSILTPLLQAMTVDVTVFVVRLWGIPMHVVGNFVTIPAGRFEIVSGCSGTHQFAVAVVFTVLAARIGQKSLWQKGVLIGAGLLLTLIANWVRVSALVIVGQTSNMQSYLIQDEHVTFGWGLFVLLVVVPIVLMGRVMNQAKAQRIETVSPRTPAAAGNRLWSPIATSTIAVVAIAAGPLLASYAAMANHSDPVPLRVPRVGGGWSEPFENHTNWTPWFAGADSIVAASYEHGGDTVDVYILSYYQESQGRELINQSNTIADPRSWKFKSQRDGRSEYSTAQVLPWREIEVSSASGRSRIIRYWYDIAGRQTTRPLKAKLLQAWARLGGEPRGSLVAVAAACDSNCDRASATLDDFLSTGVKQLLDLDAVEILETSQ